MFTGCVEEEPAEERGRGGTKPGAVVLESRGKGRTCCYRRGEVY